MHKMVHLYHMADIPLIVHRPYEIKFGKNKPCAGLFNAKVSVKITSAPRALTKSIT